MRPSSPAPPRESRAPPLSHPRRFPPPMNLPSPPPSPVLYRTPHTRLSSSPPVHRPTPPPATPPWRPRSQSPTTTRVLPASPLLEVHGDSFASVFSLLGPKVKVFKYKGAAARVRLAALPATVAGPTASDTGGVVVCAGPRQGELEARYQRAARSAARVGQAVKRAPPVWRRRPAHQLPLVGRLPSLFASLCLTLITSFTGSSKRAGGRRRTRKRGFKRSRATTLPSSPRRSSRLRHAAA